MIDIDSFVLGALMAVFVMVVGTLLAAAWAGADD